MQKLIQITACHPHECKFNLRAFDSYYCAHPAFDDFIRVDSKLKGVPTTCPLLESPLIIVYRLDLDSDKE